MTLTATRRPLRELDPCAYECRRCGVIRTTKSTRGRPVLCRDCQAVLALDATIARLPDPVRAAFEDDRVTVAAALNLARENEQVKAHVAALLLEEPRGCTVDLGRLSRRAKNQLRATAAA